MVFYLYAKNYKNRLNGSKDIVIWTRASQDPSALPNLTEFNRVHSYHTTNNPWTFHLNPIIFYWVIVLTRYLGQFRHAWASFCPNWPEFNRVRSYHPKNNPWTFHQNHIMFDWDIVLTRYLGQFGPTTNPGMPGQVFAQIGQNSIGFILITQKTIPESFIQISSILTKLLCLQARTDRRTSTMVIPSSSSG